MDRATAMAINEVSKKINDVQKRMDDFFSSLHKANKSDIEFLAMMGDVDLDVDSEATETEKPAEETEDTTAKEE